MSNPATIAHGPALVGTFMNVLLFGIQIMQVYIYFVNFPKDKTWMKVFIAGLFTLDLWNCVFDMWWIYDILVNHFGDFPALTTGNWLFATDPAMVGIIATSCQLFFAWRVHVLTRNRLVVAFIVLTAITSLCGGLGTAIATSYVPEFVEFQKFRAIVIMWVAAELACDTAITVALSWHLHTHRTGFAVTDDILSKVIRLTVQNGLLTTLCAIAHLVTYLATPTALHLAFNYPIGKLYSNALLSTLNTRAGFAVGPTSRGDGSTSSAGVNNAGMRSQRGGPRAYNNKIDIVSGHRPEVFVNVDVETHEMSDAHGKAGLEDSPDQWSYDLEGKQDARRGDRARA